MAIDLVREIHEGDYTEQIGQTEGSRTFLVHSTDGNVREDVILSAAGIPLPSDSHPASPFSLCRRRIANRLGQQMKGLWRVECFYSNAPLTREQEEKILIQNPTLRPAVVDTSVVRDEVPCDTDRTGKSYKNSANDPFDPHPSKMRSRLQINVRKNFATIPEFYWALGDTINYHDLTIGHGINKTCRDSTLMFVPGGTSEQKEDNGISYVEVRFTLDFKESFRTLGFYEFVLARDELRTGSEESPVWVPVPSDWVGVRMPGEAATMIPAGQTVRRRIGWDREILDAGYYHLVADGEDDDTLEDRERFTDLNGGFATTPQYLDGEGHGGWDVVSYLQFGDYWYGDFRVLAGILA